MNNKLLLIGGGGHCRSIIDSVLSMHEYEDIGIVDYKDAGFQSIPVIGTDEDLPLLIKQGWKYAFISVGSVGDTYLRRHLYQLVKGIGFKVPSIIDPSAVVARGIAVDEGSFIGKKAVINAGVALGKCTIINTGAVIEHDCNIGDFAHISPGAVLCGNVNIGNDTHIGAGTVVRQQINIGSNVLVGAGSVVVKDIKDGIKAYGNPCKVVD